MGVGRQFQQIHQYVWNLPIAIVGYRHRFVFQTFSNAIPAASFVDKMSEINWNDPNQEATNISLRQSSKKDGSCAWWIHWIIFYTNSNFFPGPSSLNIKRNDIFRHAVDELNVGIIKRLETQSEILINNNNNYNKFMVLSSNRFKYAQQSADEFFFYLWIW